MSFKTPSKSVFNKANETISPKKNSSKQSYSQSMSNSIRINKSQKKQSAQSSLLQKIIQSQISQEEEYQNLLILNKQLQIKILALQDESQRLKKQFKKANKPIEEIKAKLQSSKTSFVEKQKYLERFYAHLDSKLRSNLHSNLFGKLQRIEMTLEQKYQAQKKQLYTSLALQNQKVEYANAQLERLKQQRDQVVKQYTYKAIQSSSQKNLSQNKTKSGKGQKNDQRSNKNSEKIKFEEKISQKDLENEEILRRKEQKKQAKEQLAKQCQYLKQSINKLRKQKQMAQKDERLLKQLLNIDEQHKKYSSYILNGYKKVFTVQYRQQLCNRKNITQNNNGIKDNLSSKQSVDVSQQQLKQKVTEKKILQKQIDQTRKQLEQVKQKFNSDLVQYSYLEEQIRDISNSNTGKNDQRQQNSRMTYNPNYDDYPGNHRSTYTSYQKKSDDDYEDL